MYGSLGLSEITGLTPAQAAVWLGAGLGLAFGVLAAITGFCLRRGIVAGPGARNVRGIWAMAFFAALIGTQGAVALGWTGFAAHRFHAADLPLLAILLGGALFGAGMVLTRGCPSRLLVLGASGNLRALIVLLVFALVAQATVQGVLAPLRTALTGLTVPVGAQASLGHWPGGTALWTALLAAGALALVWRAGARPRDLTLAALIGLLIPVGWVGTGLVLFDEFEPIAHESLAFTAPAADTLFYAAAATAVPANFGVAVIAFAFLGAAAVALIRREAAWASFEGPAQTGRYGLGAALMGVGGVVAGGCTVGAGLSGTATLSLAALLALGAIVAGARVTDALMRRDASATGAPSGTPRALPAQ